MSIVMHQVGQILAARAVQAPMHAVVFTATLAYQVYDEEPITRSRVHFWRAAGGPLSNLLLGLAALGALHRGAGRFMRMLAAVNLIFSAAAMSPLPTMDGGVMLREIRHWRA